jgi:hypothetical protein
MPEVNIEAALPLAAPAARDAVQRALAEMCARSRDGAIALTAVVTSNGEHVARIEVPVMLDSDAGGEPKTADLSLHIRARSMEGLFPTFSGRIAVDADGSADSLVRLRGEYHVPLGVLGALANTLTLDSIANDSLQRFLHDVTHEALEGVREATEERLREVRGGAL